MNATKLLPHYSYEDYCHWQGRWEVISGIPFALNTENIPRHQWLVLNIGSKFINAIKKAKCKDCKVYDFIDVIIEDDTILQPDCSIVCKPITKKFLDFPATLVVEILSSSTTLKDRHTKFSLYENFGIKYYLIVNQDKEEVEIYCLENSKYVLQKSSLKTPFVFSLDEDCEIKVLLKDFFE